MESGRGVRGGADSFGRWYSLSVLWEDLWAAGVRIMEDWLRCWAESSANRDTETQMQRDIF